VISIVPGKLMVLSSFDYKSMAAYAQAKINSNMADFLCSSCEIFKMFSYSKLISIARKMTKRSFQAGETILNQNDISTGLLVIESGSIKIKRDISLSDIASKSFYSNKPLNEKFQNTKLRSHIKISLAELGPGDLFKPFVI
jgi:CRP-like cAMP-binding protein